MFSESFVLYRRVIYNYALISKIFDIFHFGAVHIHLDENRAICQRLDRGNIAVVIHMHMVQILQSAEILKAGNLVVGSVDRHQLAALGECRDRFDLVIREIEVSQVGQHGEFGNIRQRVGGYIQLCKGSAGSKDVDIRQLIALYG